MPAGPLQPDTPPSTAPIVPGAPPWQPPPAFTAAAAGMQVWPSSGPDAHSAPQWPAATGEPVWSDGEETTGRPGESGDVPVWPPSTVHDDAPAENTVNVRANGPAVPAPQERADLARASEPGAHTATSSAASSAGYAPSAPPSERAVHTADVTSPVEPGAYGPAPVPSAESGQAQAHAPGRHPAPAPSAGQEHAPASSPDLGHPHGPAAPPSPGTGHPSGEGPTQGAGHPPEAAQQGGSTPVAQEASSPTPASSAEQVTHASAPLSETTQRLPAPPAFLSRPAEPDAPSSLPESGDQPTPPGGIPVVSSPFPPAVGRRTQPLPAPPATSGEVVPRGPFTPPSAVVHELPPAPAAPPPRKRGNTILIAAVVTLVVGGTGTGAFFAYQSFSAKRSASAEAPIPTSEAIDPTEDPGSLPEPDPVNTEILNSEKTDPGKMTVEDAFTKKVTLAGGTFVRVKTDVTQKCDEAAAGRFASTLTGQDCRRVLRATYVDSKRKYAVTTGIAVMPSLQSAVEVDRAKNLGSNLWFRGLQGTPGSGAERVHIAGGYAAGLVWGRYIVFSYATFSDGHTPTAKEKTLGKVSGAFRDETAKVVERRVTG
ncbi:hypothetical protein [Streptosporangium carneum]|uniref:Uncharacterized protein n=1 Tax=Streptosporangium carneum TaxID=47481 RepID=A0A9W6I505_9ACTN|nr:hypothetical protein [Streptosporangium carneum]GLK11808.1 hypothetical protein GCM10017600_52160 [Streptosporangium carneum]